jgi:uncharacterized protein (TIGR02145 family)
MFKLRLIAISITFNYLLFGQNSSQTITQKKETEASKTATTVPAEIGTVKIGTQAWMTKNLEVTTFRNGDSIFHAKTIAEWEQAAKAKKPAWCFFLHDPKNGARTGKLYNWYAATDPRNLAPKGFHVPNEDDWNKLINFLGGEEVAAPKMRYGKLWGDSILIISPKGMFGALPTGWLKYTESKSEFLNDGAYWWSTIPYSPKIAWTRYLVIKSIQVKSYCYNKGSGLAVRCVKD